MKPLSEQALKEAVLIILRYPNGKRPPRNSIAEEIRHEQAEKLLDLILSDRKAWGEQTLDYGSWIEPKCHLHEKYTSACCGCQKEQRAYHVIEDYKDWIKRNQGEVEHS